MKRSLAASFLAMQLFGQVDPVIRTGTNEVIVDVVVRDKKGKLVRGLGTDDFSIFEDGTKQKILQVREILGGLTAEPEASPERPSAAAPRPSNPTTDSTRRFQLITLVFDRMSNENRRLARQAANELVKADLAANVYVAVFTTDLKLNVVLPFSNDHVKLKAAIERATGGGMTNYADAGAGLREAAGSTAGSEGASAAAAAGSQGSGVDGGAMAQEQMGRMVTDMLDFADSSAREQQGRSSIFGLWGIVREQGRLPGRKTVVYFSEGIVVPYSLLFQFRNMMSAANRANVSIYPVDARGLQTNGDSQASRDILARNAAISIRNNRSTETGSAVTRTDDVQFERALDSIHSNGQLNLQEMAEATGGTLIANSNDFRLPLRRAIEEQNSYYEVVYRPEKTDLDGSFRTIETKVSRPDVKVQARNGYFALPSVAGANLYPYEVPLLKALGATPLPRGIDFRANVVRGKPTATGYLAEMVFEMPLRDVTFRTLETGAYRTHVSFLALVKDAQGQVVGKISRDLPVEQPKERLEGFQSGRVIFTRVIKLEPGRYTIEAAASDIEGKKIAARKTALVVPGISAGKIGLSGITLVRRFDEAPATPEADDMFVAGKKRVIPTLQDAVPGGPKNALSLFFTIFPAPGAEKPTAEMAFLLDEKMVGGGTVELPPAQADGSIPYVATVPLEAFKPGQYEVRVRARQGQDVVQQSIFVTVE